MNDPDSLWRVMQDATFVFGMTDFWQHLKDSRLQRRAAESGEPINALASKREIAQGRVYAGTV